LKQEKKSQKLGKREKRQSPGACPNRDYIQFISQVLSLKTEAKDHRKNSARGIVAYETSSRVASMARPS